MSRSLAKSINFTFWIS